MNRIDINGAKLKEIRYSRELPARVVAELIDSSPQYLMNLEDGKQPRTSTNYLHRLGMVYTDEAVAEAITSKDQRRVFMALVAKRRELIASR